MATSVTRYVRPIEEVRADLLKRAAGPHHPWPRYTQAAEAGHIFANIHSLDRDQWAEAFSAVARPYEERARAAEAAGIKGAAEESYWQAYTYYRMARYPAPNSPGKLAAYLKSVELFQKAARYLDPPLERVTMPFNGRTGEGEAVIGYLRKPLNQDRAPLVVRWGGIDTFKEEWPAEPFLERNLALLAIDMPGTGQAPVAGSEDAERMFGAVFDWVTTRPDIDASRVGIIGGSTGGYWAAKVAHVYREQVRAAVDWGGCAHYAFTPEWIEQAQHGEYALELAETLATAFGLATLEQWVDYAPRLSLLDQGILDQSCTRLLLVNGLEDSIFPISDMFLLLEHGGPKTARFFPRGHMARGPDTEPMVLDWMEAQLK